MIYLRMRPVDVPLGNVHLGFSKGDLMILNLSPQSALEEYGDPPTGATTNLGFAQIVTNAHHVAQANKF